MRIAARRPVWAKLLAFSHRGGESRVVLFLLLLVAAAIRADAQHPGVSATSAGETALSLGGVNPPSHSHSPVTLYRDPWGTPHAYADREEDGFYGLGYAQAEDRLSTILTLYLRVRGEEASVFGRDFIDADADQLLL